MDGCLTQKATALNEHMNRIHSEPFQKKIWAVQFKNLAGSFAYMGPLPAAALPRWDIFV